MFCLDVRVRRVLRTHCLEIKGLGDKAESTGAGRGPEQVDVVSCRGRAHRVGGTTLRGESHCGVSRPRQLPRWAALCRCPRPGQQPAAPARDSASLQPPLPVWLTGAELDFGVAYLLCIKRLSGTQSISSSCSRVTDSRGPVTCFLSLLFFSVT